MAEGARRQDVDAQAFGRLEQGRGGITRIRQDLELGLHPARGVVGLQALGLEKDALVRALGVSFLVSTIALGVSLGQGGALPAASLLASALAVLPALLGMGAGQWLRGRVRPETFKTVFFAGLLLLGLYLAVRAALRLA